MLLSFHLSFLGRHGMGLLDGWLSLRALRWLRLGRLSLWRVRALLTRMLALRELLLRWIRSMLWKGVLLRLLMRRLRRRRHRSIRLRSAASLMRLRSRLRLRSDTLRFVHILTRIRTLLRRSRSRLTPVVHRLALLSLVGLRLLKGKYLLLLLHVLRMSMRQLLLRMVHLKVDRSHRRVRLHSPDLSCIHALSAIRHGHRHATGLGLLVHHTLSDELLLMLRHQLRVVRD